MTRFSNHKNDAEYQQLVRDVAHEISLCLNDEVPAVRLAAIEALTLIKDIDANSTIIRLLKDEKLFIRAKAAESLGIQVYKAAIPDLFLLLPDKNPTLTLDGIEWLENFQLPLPIIRVCDFAFRALMNFDDETILLTLRQSLTEADPLLKAYVCRSIDRVKAASDREAFTSDLGNLLVDNSPVIDDKLVSELLESIFSQLSERINVKINEEVLKAFDEIASGFRRSAEVPVCCHAVIALSTIGTPDAIRHLLTAIDNLDSFTRGLIIDALGDWLRNFPDSGWSSRHEITDIDPAIENLRLNVIARLIPLLNDDTIFHESGETIRICDIAAQSLSLSGNDKAKLAVEQWQENNRE